MVWQEKHLLDNGKFEIIEFLGRGGFGLTYKVLHRELDTEMVIKTPDILQKKDIEYEEYVKQFKAEGRKLAKISQKRHPHIVRVSDIFMEDQVPCLVMDFIQGQTLMEKVKTEGALSEAECLKYIRQIGDALEIVHKAGMVHRDAHPGNIIIQPNGEAILIDFGIAKEIIPASSSSMNIAVGNKSFAPYEQLFHQSQDKEYQPHRSPTVDIYTLAASFYYAITGIEPTPALDRKLNMADKKADPLKNPKEINPNLRNDHLNEAILLGMAFERENRPQSMKVWLQRLELLPLEDFISSKTSKKIDRSAYRKKIYAIGVGGAGAKCIESAIFLHSLGIFGDSYLGILLVDGDISNGNIKRTQITLSDTIKCQQLFKADLESNNKFMSGGFDDYGIWNPLGKEINSNNLSKIFNKQDLEITSPALAKLFDVLYSPDEQVADLAVGFRSRPPIGSAVMSRLELETSQNNSDNNWQRLLNNIQTDLANGDEVSIHLFGSIFGGTGASGVPTLATLISKQLRDNNLRKNIHLNSSLLLPYFSFDKSEKDEQKVFAETRFFTLNTQAALQYLIEYSAGVFDMVYLIGNQERKIYEASAGGTKQQNDAHFVELYASLAINHGFSQEIGKTQVAYISRTNQENLTWQDLPDREIVKTLLAKGVRFAYAWYYNFALELDSAQKSRVNNSAKTASWLYCFFDVNDSDWSSLLFRPLFSPIDNKYIALPFLSDTDQKYQAEILERWSKSFLIWVQQISQSHRSGEQLFHLKHLDLKSKKRIYMNDLSGLILDNNKTPKEKNNDNLKTFKNKLVSQGRKGKGVFGLAHQLFNLI